MEKTMTLVFGVVVSCFYYRSNCNHVRCSLNGSSNAVNQHFNRSFANHFAFTFICSPFLCWIIIIFLRIFPATNLIREKKNNLWRSFEIWWIIRSLTGWSWIRLVCIVPCLNYQCECTLQINEINWKKKRHYYYFVFWNWKSQKVKINL